MVQNKFKILYYKGYSLPRLSLTDLTNKILVSKHGYFDCHIYSFGPSLDKDISSVSFLSKFRDIPPIKARAYLDSFRNIYFCPFKQDKILKKRLKYSIKNKFLIKSFSDKNSCLSLYKKEVNKYKSLFSI